MKVISIGFLVASLVFGSTTVKYESVTRDPVKAIKLLNMESLKRIATSSVIAEQMVKTILCESGGRQYDKNGQLVMGKAREIGIAQFKPQTFQGFAKEYDPINWQNYDIRKEADQLTIMEYAFKHGYQKHWSCWRNLYTPAKTG